MSAAEYSFPAPPAPHSDWLTVCANVFNDYVSRWNTSTCGGGLKWQIYPENSGYTYKNTISNGGFFQLSARLARVTGNQTYVDWANKIYDWSSRIGLIDSAYNVYDGSDETINCTEVNHGQWSYNAAMFLYGSAVLHNYTNGSELWTSRTTGFLNAASTTFFSPYANATNILFEAACETEGKCNIDQYSQKAYMSRWLAATSKLAPYTAGRISELLRASALGAVASCTGPANGGTQCGSRWYTNGYDNTPGMGQQMSAMEVLYALLVNETQPPALLGGVRIRSEPTYAPSLLPAEPSGSRETARPLYDRASMGGASGRLRRSSSWIGGVMGGAVIASAIVVAFTGLGLVGL